MNSKTTITINRYGMGEADSELSLLLLRNYLTLLAEEKLEPRFICLYAEGVKLATDGSPVLSELKALEERGTSIFVCRTCLNFYGLENSVKAGTVSTMLDIIGAQTNCSKVITL